MVYEILCDRDSEDEGKIMKFIQTYVYIDIQIVYIYTQSRRHNVMCLTIILLSWAAKFFFNKDRSRIIFLSGNRLKKKHGFTPVVNVMMSITCSSIISARRVIFLIRYQLLVITDECIEHIAKNIRKNNNYLINNNVIRLRTISLIYTH